MLFIFKDRRLRVFESRILRRIFGLQRNGNGERRRLHREEVHSVYRSHNIVRVIKSRRLRWAGHVTRSKRCRSASKILIGTPVGKTHLGRPRLRWEECKWGVEKAPQ